MADMCGVAMLFIRCHGGIISRPEEFASAADMSAAIDATIRLLADLLRAT